MRSPPPARKSTNRCRSSSSSTAPTRRPTPNCAVVMRTLRGNFMPKLSATTAPSPPDSPRPGTHGPTCSTATCAWRPTRSPKCCAIASHRCSRSPRRSFSRTRAGGVRKPAGRISSRTPTSRLCTNARPSRERSRAAISIRAAAPRYAGRTSCAATLPTRTNTIRSIGKTSISACAPGTKAGKCCSVRPRAPGTAIAAR